MENFQSMETKISPGIDRTLGIIFKTFWRIFNQRQYYETRLPQIAMKNEQDPYWNPPK
jgi:hypothetical protein